MIKAKYYLGVSAFAKAVFLTLTLTILSSCKEKQTVLSSGSADLYPIDSTLTAVDSLEQFIKPYRVNLAKQMDSVISYNEKLMHKNDFELNTPISNMFAQVVREQGNSVYRSRTGKDIDVILLNHGGIRAALPQGNITMGNAYEIMPFENKIVVAELSREKMEGLIRYLVEKKRAHPIEGMKITLAKDGSLKEVLIGGKPLDDYETFAVATNDYLYGGGDNMIFFADSPVMDLDYKLRNAIIDYLRKTDTLKFERDDRFDYEKN
ncbi:MAG: 5'-nucleotidase C-terminal domain-containing protein [Nonlabens sp.]